MQLTLKDELPVVTVQVVYGNRRTEIPNVLVDTGSAGTIMAADVVASIGITPDLQDELHVIHGIGGSEVVFSRKVDILQIEGHGSSQFEIEIGGMDYGFEINGILGMDFLLRTGAVIDLHRLCLTFS